MPRENPLRDENDPLGRFFRRLVDDLGETSSHQDRLTSEGGHEQRSLLDIYTTSVAAILERIRLRREGGSIVIARPLLDAVLARITYTVAEHVGLADEIVSYHEALRNFLPTSHAPSDAAGELAKCRAGAALRRTGQNLSRGMSQISLLAGVDGAVLLDSHLRIQGFGVRFPVLLPVGASVIDATTGVELACDQWGLRHQSVFSLCQSCGQVVGLIVSQDGGVKAVKSVEDRLCLWDGILD